MAQVLRCLAAAGPGVDDGLADARQKLSCFLVQRGLPLVV